MITFRGGGPVGGERQFAQLNDMVKVSLTDMMGSEQRLKEVRKREEYSRQKGPPEQRP